MEKISFPHKGPVVSRSFVRIKIGTLRKSVRF